MSSGQEADSVEGKSQESVTPAVLDTAEGNAATQTQPASGGPLSIDRIRQLRASQESSSAQNKGHGTNRRPSPVSQATPTPSGPSSPHAKTSDSPNAAVDSPSSQSQHDEGQQGEGKQAALAESSSDRPSKAEGDRSRRKPYGKSRPESLPAAEPLVNKLPVPSRRAALPDDLEREFNNALAGTDLDRMLIGDKLLQVGRELEEGQQVQARVLKVHGEHVFFSLGGPNEGVVSLLQFADPPQAGAQMDVVIRSYLPEEGLYELAVPGSAVSVADWDDLKEGEIVEAKVTAANSGGLECTVGSVRGFIPASQVAEYRIENFSEFIDQKVLCVVTQVNPSRGNLVLSRRAVLEREKAEKREQRLRDLEIGATVEGTVRKIMDFGAFVDIGGLDGLLHISQLSWEKIKHPSEVLQDGQKIQVRVDKFDAQTGKISLSYRSLQDNPWNNIVERFPVGTIVKGTVSRIADFGAFVRLATGVEGLIHLSELAHHRVHRVTNVVKEGQDIEVKVLSVEAERQRMSLSLKAAQQPPAVEQAASEPEVEEAPRELALPKHRGPLKGGTGNSRGGEQFGLKW